MSDFNPRILRRILELRQFPLLATGDLDELASLADNLVERTFPAGTLLASAGSRIDALHLILDGSIETRPRGQAWGPRQVFGALEVFADRPMLGSAVAGTEVHTLQLSAGNIGEVLEDNFSILLATLRELATRLLAASHPHPHGAIVGTRDPLGLVERLILLRTQVPFAAARLQALATLAHASDEVSWPAGTTVARSGEPATCGLVIIDGTVQARRGGSCRELGPGAPLGHLESIAGLHHTATVEATSDVRVLRSPVSAILDVLEDHADVGLAMIGTFAAALIDSAKELN